METGMDTAGYRERLVATRQALLDLHKLLLHRERAAYREDRGGPVTSGQLFELAMHDESFAWLRPILQLVVRIDEMLEWDGLWTKGDAEKVLDETRALLKASEHGTPFERKYDEALQSDPAIVFAHRAVVKAVTRDDTVQ
jgi:hypothetical protein